MGISGITKLRRQRCQRGNFRSVQIPLAHNSRYNFIVGLKLQGAANLLVKQGSGIPAVALALEFLQKAPAYPVTAALVAAHYVVPAATPCEVAPVISAAAHGSGACNDVNSGGIPQRPGKGVFAVVAHSGWNPRQASLYRIAY